MSKEKSMKEKLKLIIGEEEYEHSDPNERLREHPDIRILENKKVESELRRLEDMIRTMWNKQDIIIKMLTAIGYKVDKK